MQNEHLEVVHLKAGAPLFNEGDSTQFFYIIESGAVEIFTKDKAGKKITLAVAENGQAVGEFAFITKRHRTASAVALKDVSLVKISEKGYEELVKGLPDWVVSMIHSLIERLTQADETIRHHSLENTRLKSTLNAIMNGALKK